MTTVDRETETDLRAPTSPGTSSRSSTAAATPASTRSSTTPTARADEIDQIPRAHRRARRRGPRRAHARARRARRAPRAGRQLRGPALRGRHHRPDARRAACSASRSAATAISNELLFFELEWAELPDDAGRRAARRRAARVLPSPPALGAPLPAAPADRARRGRSSPRRRSPARSAWERLFDELMSAITRRARRRDGRRSKPGSSRLHVARPRGAAQAAAEAVTAGSRPGCARARSCSTRCSPTSRSTTACATYDRWIASRNLANEASDESVQALVDAVQGRYDDPAALVRAEGAAARARPARRLRPHGVGRRRRERVRLGRGDASSCSTRTRRSRPSSPTPRSASSTSRGSTRRCGPGKRPGAFCAYTVPSHHPYLLLNWTSRRRDVLTLAHELGHGLHAYLAREQGVFHQTTPLTLAETASVFGETVTFGRLLDDDRPIPHERLALLAENLEGQIATVFRQIAMNRFEDAMHTDAARARASCRSTGSASSGPTTQTAMLGDSVEITEGYRTWWSYIPHFIGTPGYVYAYAYGQLLALSVYRAVRGAGRRLRAAVPRPAARGRLDVARGARRASSASTSPTPRSGTGGLDIVERAARRRRSRRPRTPAACRRQPAERAPTSSRRRLVSATTSSGSGPIAAVGEVGAEVVEVRGADDRGVEVGVREREAQHELHARHAVEQVVELGLVPPVPHGLVRHHVVAAAVPVVGRAACDAAADDDAHAGVGRRVITSSCSRCSAEYGIWNASNTPMSICSSRSGSTAGHADEAHLALVAAARAAR